MMPLHQDLETDLDLGRGGFGFEPQYVEGLALGVANDAGFAAPQTLAVGSAPEMAKQAERIGSALQIRREPSRIRTCGSAPAVHPHFPGRTMANDCVLLVAHNIVVAHAGEKIVCVIVYPDVFE